MKEVVFKKPRIHRLLIINLNFVNCSSKFVEIEFDFIFVHKILSDTIN